MWDCVVWGLESHPVEQHEVQHQTAAPHTLVTSSKVCFSRFSTHRCVPAGLSGQQTCASALLIDPTGGRACAATNCMGSTGLCTMRITVVCQSLATADHAGRDPTHSSCIVSTNALHGCVQSGGHLCTARSSGLAQRSVPAHLLKLIGS
jgi:hypothetical protein